MPKVTPSAMTEVKAALALMKNPPLDAKTLKLMKKPLHSVSS